jgi:hypothetical protein
MGGDYGAEAARARAINRENEEADAEHGRAYASLIKVAGSLDQGAGDDRCARTAKGGDFRHEEAANDQLLNPWVRKW